MATYNPDKWVVVHIVPKEGTSHYRVFASWRGGYISGDSWKFNSGIDKVTESDSYYYFHGSSGSIYECHKRSYGTTMYGSSILENFRERLTGEADLSIMHEDTNWLELVY